MSAELARRLVALDAKATPGPWHEHEHNWQEASVMAKRRLLGTFQIDEESDAEYQSGNEARLVVALRNALPQLLRALAVADAPVDDRMLREAHAMCPSPLPHLDRMRWMANYIHNEQHKRAAAILASWRR